MIWKVTTAVIFPLRGFRHWWTWNYGKLKIPFQAFLQPPIKSFIIIADMLSEEASRLLHGWPTNDQFAQHQNDFFVCVCVCGTNASYTLLPLLPIIENKNGRWLSRSIQWTSVRMQDLWWWGKCGVLVWRNPNNICFADTGVGHVNNSRLKKF